MDIKVNISVSPKPEKGSYATIGKNLRKNVQRYLFYYVFDQKKPRNLSFVYSQPTINDLITQ